MSRHRSTAARLGAVVLAAATATLTACAPPAPEATTLGGSPIPSRDVVSSVPVDRSLHASLPADVRSSGTITLGTTLAQGTNTLPHSGVVDGSQVGLDVDLRNAVARVLGVRFDVGNGTFPTIIPGVQNGRFQVGQDNFGVTAERLQVVDFATYLDDGQGFLGAPDVGLDKVTTLTDLCGKIIATSPGSTFQQILEAGKDKCHQAGRDAYEVQYFADTGPIFLGLTNGKVDVYFGPTLSLKFAQSHIPGTKFLGEISTTPVGFVTDRGSGLAGPITAAVNELIASGDYAKIFAKWDVPESGIAKSQVNPRATL